MHNRTLTILSWLVSAGAVLVPPSAGKAQDSGRPTLRVSVFNDARIPDQKLLRAETVATQIFAASGMSIDWLHCGRPSEDLHEQAACSEASFPSHLHIRIQPRSLNLNPSTVGLSYSGEDGMGQQADIFYSGISLLEQTNHADSGVLLGTVIAHELGHLLLGLDSHAPSGLMRPLWNADDLSRAGFAHLVFSPEQSRKLRARLETAVTPSQSSSRPISGAPGSVF
jgi:hypothetical protein